jgi:aryl-alcohol dehydrogenase-like predicted oxidoreductase
MKYHPIHRGGPQVSQLGLGCFSMSGAYGANDDATSEASIRRAVDLDVTLLDTSMSYGIAGHNLKLMGRALKGLRDKVVISAKFGGLLDDQGRRIGYDGSPAYVRKTCDAMLQYLQTDRVDVMCLSRVDPKVPIEDTVRAMAELVRAGKLRGIGLSEVSAATLRKSHAIHPLATLQMEYSLWTRDAEAEMIPTCRELGIGFLAYSPLGRGFLAGSFSNATEVPEDERRALPRFHPDNFDHNLRLLDAVERVARAHHASKAQVALAWLMTRGPDVFPIPSGAKRAHLEENVASCNLTLTASDIAALDAAFPPGAARGTRYHAHGMTQVGL